jgi:hypothetical protein
MAHSRPFPPNRPGDGLEACEDAVTSFHAGLQEKGTGLTSSMGYILLWLLGIPIANDVPWRLLPAVSLGQLTGNPMGARACGHTQPHKLAAGMSQDQKSIQQPKRDCRHYEQIHRCNAVGMVAQKGLPALRGWLPSPGHVFCHDGLPNIDAKLEQFAVDPRRSPKRVRDAHGANKLANVRRCLWPATARS